MGTMSRRNVLAAGAGALAGASAMACGGGLSATAAQGGQTASGGTGGTPHEATIRKYYEAWEGTDWAPIDAVLADEFTFTSAAGDDHLSKAVFKAQCWENQKGLTQNFTIEQLFGNEREALVKYLALTRKGKTFRNVEYLRFNGGKIAAIECYFGEIGSFPSSVDKKA